MRPSDEKLARILLETRTIALVGASPRPWRDSNRAVQFLKAAGYRVIPVNPTCAGEHIHGELVRGSLSDIDEPVQLVNLFRRSEAVGAHVDEAIGHLEGVKTIWMQLGVRDAAARARAEAAGLTVVEDRCIMVEHRHLIGAGRAQG